MKYSRKAKSNIRSKRRKLSKRNKSSVRRKTRTRVLRRKFSKNVAKTSKRLVGGKRRRRKKRKNIKRTYKIRKVQRGGTFWGPNTLRLKYQMLVGNKQADIPIDININVIQISLKDPANGPAGLFGCNRGFSE